MSSSYGIPGESPHKWKNEKAEKETPLGPYKTYKEAFRAGFFEVAKQDGVWIIMDPPENSRSNKPIKLKIVDIQPRRQALKLDKAGSNVINISQSEEENIMPIGETEGGSRIPISGANGRNFRLAPQENLEK